ncbi:MAG: hypothetical protein EHM46_02515, partial [Bacteroidetes bacterium]
MLLILVPVVISHGSPAQDKHYREAMITAISLVEHASARKDYLEAAARFERIASAEKSRWMPFYYGAYALIVMSYDEQDMKERDRVLDRAQVLVDSAIARNPGESEI